MRDIAELHINPPTKAPGMRERRTRDDKPDSAATLFATTRQRIRNISVVLDQ